MLRIKLVLLAVVAMLVVGALASASASAAVHWLVCLKVEAGKGKYSESECKTLGGAGEWEEKTLATVLKVEGTSGVSILKSEIGGTAVEIRCEKDKFKGEIEAPEKSKATITYEECKVPSAPTCVVPNITAKVLDKLIEEESKILEEFFEEGAGPFATVKINTGCVLAGSFPVKGTQKCELPGGEAFARLHTIECKAGGSKLTFGPGASPPAATYEGNASIQLEDHDAWRVSK